MRTLIAIPVYNEARSIPSVMRRVIENLPDGHTEQDILAIDDGSSDTTPELLRKFPINILRHGRNMGYGQSLIDAFAFAQLRKYDWVITMDCDEQHEPSRIGSFIDEQRKAEALTMAGKPSPDILSGSRYIATMDESTEPPPDRRAINMTLTAEINDRLGFMPPLTDTFCGFKSHRVSSLSHLSLTETGYAFPMQLWAQVAAKGLLVKEVPVRLIYLDMKRSFGATLDDPRVRLNHYRSVLNREIGRHCGSISQRLGLCKPPQS
jgi:glycosyltransferase involved in cell wall biosynthesis